MQHLRACDDRPPAYRLTSSYLHLSVYFRGPRDHYLQSLSHCHRVNAEGSVSIIALRVTFAPHVHLRIVSWF